MTARETVDAFLAAINARHVGRLTELMTDDHVFIDSLGASVTGRETMRNAWISYFYLVPDYAVTCDAVFEEGQRVALFGTAEGTCLIGNTLKKENHWKIPASWLAEVRDGKIARWQVYADNDPVRSILARAT